jgi:hypothetical protein
LLLGLEEDSGGAINTPYPKNTVAGDRTLL